MITNTLNYQYNLFIELSKGKTNMNSKVRLVNFNGDLIPENEAKISIYDSALMFGDMVFEMTRSFNKEQFKLEEHIARLYTGLKIPR